MSRKLRNSKRRQAFKRMLLCGRAWVECHYCGKHLTFDTITLDHVIPLSKGGPMGIRNIVAACLVCNRQRGNQPYKTFVRRVAA